MKSPSFFEFINLDEYSSTPKSLQLSNAIISMAEARALTKGTLLPSGKVLNFKMEVSMDTAESGNRHHKVIGSKAARGKPEKNIYDLFISELTDDVPVDLLKIISPEKTYRYKGMLKRFLRFCGQHAFFYKTGSDISIGPIGKDEVFISLRKDDWLYYQKGFLM